ncbi:transcriptional regulator family: Fungal Specific TF [Penicillium paradoxum]|uniref:transcriptional regulator family: Fungal Specific TF n=1 Tax=Penicillium paradoxum TaxID=176176 RepID=UPI00254727F0|nr:transcriptional regulator family: Fungal Specific TF [Penicillium paradoxum]KAJ5788561.1 transcriptional regulator family: Fungal Specific TF [Penicillium paradoxum]
MQLEDQIQNQIHQASASTSRSKPRSRPSLRTSCDSCSATKVRCTKEQPTCSRCIKNGLKCIYGRSRRKGKPSSSNVAALKPLSALPSPASPSQSVKSRMTGYQTHHSNANYSCSWFTSPMFPTTNTANSDIGNVLPGDCENRTPQSLTSQHSTADEYATSHSPINMGPMECSPPSDGGDFDPPQRMAAHGIHDDSDDETAEEDEDEDPEENNELPDPVEDENIPCIAIACKTLYSLYHVVPPSGEKGKIPSSSQRNALSSDLVFRMTRSATATMSRLLNCTCSGCSHDVSMLMLQSAVLFKILAWYEALYQGDINDQVQPPMSSSQQSGQVKSAESAQESVYAISLNIGAFNLSRATAKRMKAQLLLCELQPLVQVCQLLDRRVQAADDLLGEKNMCDGSNARLLRKVGELQQILTEICTQAPSLV